MLRIERRAGLECDRVMVWECKVDILPGDVFNLTEHGERECWDCFIRTRDYTVFPHKWIFAYRNELHKILRGNTTHPRLPGL